MASGTPKPVAKLIFSMVLNLGDKDCPLAMNLFVSKRLTVSVGGVALGIVFCVVAFCVIDIEGVP
jgi:hypothetical protein